MKRVWLNHSDIFNQTVDSDKKVNSNVNLSRQTNLSIQTDRQDLVNSPQVKVVYILNIGHFTNRTTRSFLSFLEGTCSVDIIAHSFVLLRVLDLQKCHLNVNLEGLEFLVHLRPRLGIAFPATLKKLSLSCELPWSHMSIIQLLPNLEVLKLQDNIFTIGRWWDACEQQFPQRKLLKLSNSHIEKWEASSTSFPCLKQLLVSDSRYLEEIPLEIREITTLENIKIYGCSKSVVESVQRIQQEQHDEGNDELKITVDGMELSLYLSQHGCSELER
ncbi:hypothetical protein OSB04_015613 [Centaurea solstitialis]|uniref:Uncharacterized protein n=1 Tax=Centaurea solstitialis TaxID=347529 RepID=A0AA38T773_9ASTR|nr:hypothetical protein OSB04_015613 [Centaurea solstitialis]